MLTRDVCAPLRSGPARRITLRSAQFYRYRIDREHARFNPARCSLPSRAHHRKF
jgi:hypothetical protein